ncbi:MAG: two-component regulator propeller domain-containing protein, partial [Rhodothermales bacterium]
MRSLKPRPRNLQPPSLRSRSRKITAADGLSDQRVNDIFQDSVGLLFFATDKGLARFNGVAIKTYDTDELNVETGVSFDTLRTATGHRITRLVREAPDGSLWIATEWSLDRFDPTTGRFATYPFHADDVPRPNRVLQMTPDQKGNIWMVVADGVTPDSLYLRQRLNRLSMTPDGRPIVTAYRKQSAPVKEGNVYSFLPDDDVSTIHLDGRGRIWAGMRHGGLAAFDTTRQRFESIAGIGGHVLGIASADAAILVVSRNFDDASEPMRLSVVIDERDSRSAVGTVPPGSVSLSLPIGNPPRCSSTCPDYRAAILIDPDEEGFVWVATDALYRINVSDQHVDRISLPESMRDALVTEIVATGEGSLWLATTSGLALYARSAADSAASIVAVTSSAGLEFGPPLEAVADLFVDRSGNLWVSMWEYGLYRLDPFRNSFLLARTTSGAAGIDPPIDRALGLLELRDGSVIWIVDDASRTRRRGVYRFDSATGVVRRLPASIRSNKIAQLYEDTRGRIWISTDDDGLILLSPDGRVVKHWTADGQPGSIGTNLIRRVFEDRFGTFWVGTGDRGGLHRLDEATDTFERFVNDPADSTSITANYATSMLEDSEGRFWIGTNIGGLSLMNRDKGTFTQYHHDLSIFDVVEAGRDSLWLATYSDGLVLFHAGDGSIEVFGAENAALPEQTIYSMEPFGDDLLWLNHQASLSLFDIREKRVVDVFRSQRGFADSGRKFVFSRGRSSGFIYAGGNTRVDILDPSRLPVRRLAPPIVVDSVLVNGMPTVGSRAADASRIRDLHLSSYENNLTVKFTAVNPTFGVEGTSFRLAGYEERWNSA